MGMTNPALTAMLITTHGDRISILRTGTIGRHPDLALAAAEYGTTHPETYSFPADRRDDILAVLQRILDTRTEWEAADPDDAEAAAYDLVRLDRTAGHPLGDRFASVPGGTVYRDGLTGGGAVTIYDRS